MRPCSTAATMVAKLSSARIILAAPLATSVPVMPMAMPMSAAPMAGASLTPSPVIATMLPFRLQHLDQPDLVLRGDAREHADLVDLPVGLLVAQGAELGAGHGAALDAQLAGRSPRRSRHGHR